MKKFPFNECKWVVLLLLFAPLSQVFCTPSDSSLTFDIDITRFRMNDSTALAEVHIAVPRERLKFVDEGTQWRASFVSEVVITKADSPLIRHRWQAYHTARTIDDVRPGQMLFTQAQFQVPVGSYNLFARVEDENNQAFTSKTLPLVIQSFPPTELCLSDLQLASLIEKDSTVSLFYKNRYKVIPNPAALYGAGMPMLYTYSEIYNLSFPSDSGYAVAYRVLDSNGREAKVLPRRRRRIIGRSLVEVNAFNTATLPAGTYSLEGRVRDENTAQEAINVRKFFVYREPDPAAQADAPDEGLNALLSQYRSKSLAELDHEFTTVAYIALEEESKIFLSLSNDEAKREFMARFWNKRDRSPETLRNEFREDYLARVVYADKHFTGLREGWKTDLGRVLLIYGFPSEIDRVPSSGESRAHQTWKYFEIEGGVEFIFVDIKGWGNYELVHSTARNELQDPNWQRWLFVQ